MMQFAALTYYALNNILNDFKNFLTIDKQLQSATVYQYYLKTKKHLLSMNRNPRNITRRDLREYLVKYKDVPANTYSNELKALKVFYRDYLEMPDVVSSFRFPTRPFVFKSVPTKEDLIKFYNKLEEPMAKTMFLMYATTGLRRNEVLGLTLDNIRFNVRMVTPRKCSTTKHSYITFYNSETQEVLNLYLRGHKSKQLFPSTEKYFRRKYIRINREIGTHITPQVLREWFSCEMGELGVPDRYIDAFCGRVPRSILARHYTDYSPQRLKRIYDKANLKVLA